MKNIPFFLLLLPFCVLYYFLGYIIPREDTIPIFLCFFTLYFLSYFLFKRLSTRQILYAGILFRLLLFFTLPWLSQDFYRFIWDGEVQVLGYSPYEFTPNEFIEGGLSKSFPEAFLLREKMGSLSAKHYTVYPPFNQWLFFVAAWVGKSLFSTALVLRLFILLGEIALFFIAVKLLKKIKSPVKNIGFYFLNPLVIIELTGNLHFEGIMLLFFGGSLLFLYSKRNSFLASVLFSLSVGSKLVTLLFLPLFWRYLNRQKRFIFFGSSFLIIFSLFFFYFKNHDLLHFFNSLSLWFNNFEFNASFFYLIRYLGFQGVGFNIIRIWGLFSPFLIVLIVLVFSLSKKNTSFIPLIKNLLMMATCYFFISTTIHPWYIITLIFIGIFTKYKFPYIWGGLIFLSYATYGNPEFRESSLLLWIEYLIVYSVFLLEVFPVLRKVRFNRFRNR